MIKGKIKDIIYKLQTDTAFSGTIIVTVGTFVASIFSYAMQLFLSRVLSVGSYGTFNALLSLASILLVPSSVLTITLVKISAELKATNDFGRLTKLFWVLHLYLFILSLLIFTAFYFSGSTLSSYFKITPSSYFTYLGLFIVSTFFIVVPSAYLQGLLRFKAFSFFNVFSTLSRFILVMVFVFLKLDVIGVFLGMAMADFLTFGICILLLKKNFVELSNVSVTPLFKKILLFSAPVLIISLGMMLLNNVDVILVKKYFDDVSAGYYAGVVTVGKVLLFGTGTVTLVMFPQISQLIASKQPFIKKFNEFLIIQLLVVFGAVAVFCLVPQLIISVMFGQSFLPAVVYLPKFAVFMGLYVLINFFISFFLAVNKTRVFLIQIPFVALQFWLITLYHISLDAVINLNISLSGSLLLVLVIYYLYCKKVNKQWE